MSTPRPRLPAVMTLVEVAEFLGRLVGKTRVKTRTLRKTRTLMKTRTLEEGRGSALHAARARWATIGTEAPVTRSAALPGPMVKPNQPLPCGCQVAPEANGKLHLRHCRTHV